MKDASSRVGVHQYLVLGAIVQSPTGTLSAAQLHRHFTGHSRYFSLSPIIHSLLRRGCIEMDGKTNLFKITEHGASALRGRSRTGTAAFLRLRASVISEEEVSA